MTNQKKEELILYQNKKILDLEKELEEKSNFIWLIGEIIKHSGNLQSESELAYLIIDMLIGIFGLSGCSLRIRQDNNKYNLYTISNYSDNKFTVFKNRDLEDKFINVNNIKISTKNESSYIISPIHDFKNNDIFAFLSASHNQNDFFSKTKQEFFYTLTIQLSNVLINSQLYRKVSMLSNKDILTNCLNRRYLYDLVDYNGSEYITYILFDLDNFKLVNDNYGHEKGDELLIEISNLTINFFKKYHGRVIRYGGDEFIVILEMDLDMSIELLAKFKSNLLSNDLIQSFPFKVSASFGIANYPLHSKNLNNLIEKADAALYKAKETGKNKIEVYENIR